MKQRLTTMWGRLAVLLGLAIRRHLDARVAIAGWLKSMPSQVLLLLVMAILAAQAAVAALRRLLAPVVRHPLAPQWRDLVAMAALAVLALVVALLPVPGWMKVVAVLPLVLALPGYAVAAALFPFSEISRDERLVFIFAFSVGASALGGLLVQVILPLDRAVWAALLVFLTLLAGVVALKGRGQPPGTVDRDGHPPGGADQKRPRLPRMSPFSAAATLGALLIAGVAIAIATRGAHRQQDSSHFSSLWVVPQGGGAGTGDEAPVSIGISNQEGREASYLLRVRRDGVTLRDWRIHLVPDQQWQRGLAASAISGTGPLRVQLYRGGELYRHTSLGIGASA
jgi:uncharacterized membrane protein